MSELLLGIDVGTTGVRGAIFDAAGARMGDASEPCPHEAPATGFAEADADGWWRAVQIVCRRLREHDAAAMQAVAAVGVTGQAPTAVLVDAAMRPVRRAILWLDVRAEAEARALEAELGPGRAEAIGGNRMHAYFLGPKLAWLRAHEPEVLQRAALVLQSHAFVAAQLTGQAACDPSTAMLSAPLFDAHAGAWSEPGAAAVGVPARLLPRIVASREVLGPVSDAAATATGIPRGTPVVSGGGDFAASALGAGVVEEGEACLMLGTAGNLLLPMRSPRFDSRLLQSRHVGADRWLALGGTLCGAVLEWFRRTCAVGASWGELEAEASAVEVGAGGVVMLPYLQGERTPIWDERARGSFSGLELTHGRGHLFRAVVEGIALGFRDCLEVAEQGGTLLASVVAANGAGRSALLRQALADALGVPLAWSSGAAATVAGAAILGGLGAGVLTDPAVGRTWGKAGGGAVSVKHLPDPRAHARLREVLARRRALHRAETAARAC